MTWTIVEEQIGNESIKRNAGSKAREDLYKTFIECGMSELSLVCPQIERRKAGIIGKILYHWKTAVIWKKAFSKIGRGDVVVIQFPTINHSLFLDRIFRKAKENEITIIAFIHDLEILRMSNAKEYSILRRWRMRREELDELKLFDKIVAHNESMKKVLVEELGLNRTNIVSLEIFDYIVPPSFEPQMQYSNYRSCIIAGNLSRNKSAFIYDLPSSPEFELYGLNYEKNNKKNIRYNGSFLPDDLPFHLNGGFGIVWDGDSVETCSGAWGEYLKYNNPHKASLYLASGIPVIIWERAALANYILQNDVGITIRSLEDLDDVLSTISQNRYIQLRKNAIKQSEIIRSGENTKKVLRELRIYNGCAD